MSESEESGWWNLAALFLIFPLCWWEGYTVATLWRWFVAPLGVALVSPWQGAGFALIAHVVAHQTTREQPLMSQILFNGFMRPFMALAFGLAFLYLGGLS